MAAHGATWWVEIAQRASQLRVRSALNPILWLCAIICPTFLGFAIAFRDSANVRDLLIVVSILPVLVACGGFIYFAIRSPEKLQSEEYQLRHESLQLIQQGKGLIENLASVKAIANPALPAPQPEQDTTQ